MLPRTQAFLSLCLAASLAAQEPRNNKQELEKLQGEWERVSITVRGSVVTSGTTNTAKIKDDQWTITAPRTDATTNSVTLIVDGSKDPKTLDRKSSTGESRPGIYKLEGDTLTICSESGGGVRPKDFAATATNTVAVWKRVKK